MLATTWMSKIHIFTLVGAATLVFLLAGHYTYKNSMGGFSHPKSHDGPSAQDLLSQPFPTKIWQSWKDDSENPTEKAAGLPHQWREVNPDWRYERLTDANMNAYVRERFDGRTVDVFTSLHDPILKSDLLRYLLILKEGGVWADIDVRPLQPVSKWIPEQHHGKANLVVGIESDHHKKSVLPGVSPHSVALAQFAMLAKPGHPAIRVLVDRVLDNIQQLMATKPAGTAVTFNEVMVTTGPYAFTTALMDYFFNVTGVVHNGDEMDSLEEPRLIGDVLVLPKDSFGWLPHEHTYEKDDPIVLVQHLFISTWRPSHPG
ncbi:nucleotide-diphospho-sugar transferase [Chaetomium fimeti]|uniref:Nucleotide-diphospho-sugar transferase n=1 Tax=Chaetomium fimeti TaxID=1854472 RepID=A0AAE0LN80_9PEZI|nr:nucleotide-diphospho-sugar transferase [Chaetomium fimeti]